MNRVFVAANRLGSTRRMGSRSAIELLLLPVRLQEIRLGRPVDVLLDAEEWRVLGFVVLCGDESRRFLPYATADPREDEIAVSSALLLLDDVDFYRSRSRSLRALLGGTVESVQRELGVPSLYYATHIDTGEELDDEDYAAIRAAWAAWRERRAAA